MKKILLILLLLFGIGSFAFSGKQEAFVKPLRFVPLHFFQKACGIPLPGFAGCHAQVVTDSNGSPQASLLPSGTAFGPQQFHIGYQLPCTPGGPVAATCPQPTTFGPTIGIVDAYSDPTVANDLAVYSNNYGLPSCTVANGCLQIVNQNGGSSLPPTDSGWALETSLDVQIAHAICQTCKILLVETNSSSIADLGTGVNTAAQMGAVAISNSYGASEWFGETNYDSYYNHPGVAVTVSSGDSGYGTQFPASSPSVIAVGGTTLQLYTDSTYAGESVWKSAGSGCSKYESTNSWQSNLSNWSQTNCGSKRAVADISADADPNTGAAIYDSTPYNGSSGWWMVGGTSLSSPIIASVYAMSGVPSGNPASLLYANYPLGYFHDVVSGSNGNCLTIMCKGVTGYDGPSGLGTPNGLLGFLASGINPTPTATPTPTVTPTSTPTPTVTPTPSATPTPTPIDTTPPVVNITTPANGAIVPRFSNVTISATATDNAAVAKVEFYISGTLKATRTTSPYTYVWHTPGFHNHPYTITVKAYDSSGNTATQTITVTTSN